MVEDIHQLVFCKFLLKPTILLENKIFMLQSKLCYNLVYLYYIMFISNARCRQNGGYFEFSWGLMNERGND